jgi:DNA-binding transcriptional regulator YhcF (GntR family)
MEVTLICPVSEQTVNRSFQKLFGDEVVESTHHKGESKASGCVGPFSGFQ